jgi:hypothetical protein
MVAELAALYGDFVLPSRATYVNLRFRGNVPSGDSSVPVYVYLLNGIISPNDSSTAELFTRNSAPLRRCGTQTRWFHNAGIATTPSRNSGFSAATGRTQEGHATPCCNQSRAGIPEMESENRCKLVLRTLYSFISISFEARCYQRDSPIFRYRIAGGAEAPSQVQQNKTTWLQMNS